MAKLKAPLLSFRATGTVGDTLTVSRWKGLSVAKKVPTHPDARSAVQLAHRELYSHARDYWLTLTPTEKAQLLTEARPSSITGYNLTLRRYLSDLLQLEAWWPLHAYTSPLAEDYCLHRSHATIFGASAAADFCARSNMALHFDGINDRVVATAPQLDFTTSNFSVVARIFPTDITHNGQIIDRGRHLVSGWYIAQYNLGLLHVQTNQGGTQQNSRTAANALANDTWYTVGFTRAGADIDIYVNGLDATALPSVHQDPVSVVTPTLIGVYWTQAHEFYEGRISDLKVFSRALTPAEHLAFHQRYCVHPPR